MKMRCIWEQLDNGNDNSQAKKGGCEPANHFAFAGHPHAHGNEGGTNQQQAKSALFAGTLKEPAVLWHFHATSFLRMA